MRLERVGGRRVPSAMRLLLAVLLAAAPSTLPTDGHPFAALPMASGTIVSVTANGRPGSATGLRVFAPDGTPRCFQPLPLAQAFGMAATPDGRGLLVAAGDAGLVLLDLAQAMSCHATPVTVPIGPADGHEGSFDVAVSADGRFAFVADEYGIAGQDAASKDLRGDVGVVALSPGADAARVVTRISTGGDAVAGLVLSPDGRRLFVTSEVARPGVRAGGPKDQRLAHGGCRQGDGPAMAFGLLSVIDVARAEAGAADAVVNATAAGCSPVRVVASPDGATVWVAARGDDRVLAFDARTLALLGSGDSGGKAPVGLALFAGGTRLAVANSNRFAGPGATGSLAILNAVPSGPRVLRSVPAGHFPRSIGVGADGRTLFVTAFNGGEVAMMDGG